MLYDAGPRFPTSTTGILAPCALGRAV